jgi:hypothetical protein
LLGGSRAEADRTASEVMSVIDSIRQARTKSLRKIAAALEACGVRTPRSGTAWTAMAVKRVIDRSAGASAIMAKPADPHAAVARR